MDKERIKLDNRNIQWQKPVKLLERLLLPFLGETGTVLDPVMGTGTSGEVAQHYGYNYIGIDQDKSIFSLAKERLYENTKI